MRLYFKLPLDKYNKANPRTHSILVMAREFLSFFFFFNLEKAGEVKAWLPTACCLVRLVWGDWEALRSQSRRTLPIQLYKIKNLFPVRKKVLSFSVFAWIMYKRGKKGSGYINTEDFTEGSYVFCTIRRRRSENTTSLDIHNNNNSFQTHAKTLNILDS